MHTESPTLPFPVMDLVKRKIQSLRRLKVQPDPIIPAYLLRPHGVLSSAVRMDGHVLETAFFEALNDAPHLRVIRAPQIYIPSSADQIVGSNATKEALHNSDLFYAHGVGRLVTPDLLVIDSKRNALDITELKRGLGKSDSGKARQTARDLQCLQLIGRSYAKSQMKLDVAVVTSGVCSIHGATTVPPDLQVSLDELELRYQIDIRKHLDAAQAEFRKQLDHLLMEEALGRDLANLIKDIEILDPGISAPL